MADYKIKGRQDIQDLIMTILGQADYDLMKSYDPKTAEEPEYAEDQMEYLINSVEKHLRKLNKKYDKEMQVFKK